MNYLEEMWTQIRNMKRLTINVKRKKNMKIKVQINFMLHSYFHVFFSLHILSLFMFRIRVHISSNSF